MEKSEITPDLIEQTIRFHGHICPGLAIGIRAGQAALKTVGHNDHGGVVAITESDMCAADAIQYLTGCTFGKGNLIHLDYGKIAFSFFSRTTDKSLRIVLNPSALQKIQAEMDENLDKETLFQKQFDTIMQADFDSLFKTTPVQKTIPRPAKSMATHICDHCGEGVMESRVRLYNNKSLCIPCFASVEQKK